MDFFTASATVLVDHMGRPDVSKGVDSEEFALFLKFMREHQNVWTKVSSPTPVRNAPRRWMASKPLTSDVVPLPAAVEESRPRAVSTDWPHQTSKTTCPTTPAGGLHPAHRAYAELQRKAAVDNPRRLYWPGEVKAEPMASKT